MKKISDIYSVKNSILLIKELELTQREYLNEIESI